MARVAKPITERKSTAQLNIRISEAAGRSLENLKAMTGSNQTAIVEIALIITDRLISNNIDATKTFHELLERRQAGELSSNE